MGASKVRPRLHLGGCLFLALAWLVNLGSGLLAPWTSRAAGPTAVAAAEIEVPGSGNGICRHHQQGCPKDCFCPRIQGAEAEPHGPSARPDDRLEPSLSRCTEEHGSPGIPWLAQLDLPPSSVPEGVTHPVRRVLPADPDCPPPPDRDPPHKVPRA
jgi:hypothetical protein